MEPITLALSAVLAIIALIAVTAVLWGALARQRLKSLEERMGDWEDVKTRTIEAAKAAALSSASEMSSKLLDDHKRESESAKKETEERIKKTTGELHQQFEGVVKAVASLNDQVKQSKEMVDTVWRALSTPGGAGYFAEIGLENTLKSFGLEPGRDFVMQYTVTGEGDGKRLRPDAVVFLPGEAYLVIDSKASKFLLEIAQAEGTESEEEAYASLAKTMNLHLRSLADKDYRSAVLESSRKVGRSGNIRRLLNVMYLPNEGAVEKIRIADAEFPQKAAKSEIILAGPTGLASLVAFARVDIDLGRQAENQERIVEASQSLLESVAVAIGHVEHMGKGLKSAIDGFSKLAGSINTRLLPRARRLVGLGVRPSKKGEMPRNLPAYQVIVAVPGDVIEGEAEEIQPAITFLDSDGSESSDSDGSES